MERDTENEWERDTEKVERDTETEWERETWRRRERCHTILSLDWLAGCSSETVSVHKCSCSENRKIRGQRETFPLLIFLNTYS